jgi:photosystem II stability/assembly factor-like uncharacterized protein
LLHSRDFDTPELGETELGQLYERALARSAQLRARRTRCRAAGGMAALACLLVVGLVVGSFAAVTPGRQPVASTWRLVSEVSGASSPWQALSPTGYQQAFSLVCPSDTTCYADSLFSGQLEYTHDGGSTWHQATGTGRATSLPAISCVDARDCDFLADIAGRGSTFLTTTDGGRTWTSQPGPPVPNTSLNGAAVDAMSCATNSSCVVIAYGADSSGSSSAAFTTSDGGASWSRGTLPSSKSGTFVPTGLRCSGTTCVTTGGIGLWQAGSVPAGDPDLEGHGAIDVQGGAAYTSDDGGATWSAPSAPRASRPGANPHLLVARSLTCPDAADCYAIGGSTVDRTEDGGQTWHRVSTSGLPGPSGRSRGWTFFSMSCATSSSCWLSGYAIPANPPSIWDLSSFGQVEGLLASSADGGSTWVLSRLPAGVRAVIKVSCPDTGTCFALAVKRTGPAPSDVKVVLLTNAGQRGRAL